MPDSPSAFTLTELEERTGFPARTIRFYTGRGMLPPPAKQGRTAMYGLGHLARLELIRELQAHGFTLAAISSYLEKLPDGGSPDEIRLHRALLAPWLSERPEVLSSRELEDRAGQALDDDALELLAALGVLHPTDRDQFEVAPTLLSLGVDMVNSGLPLPAAQRAQRVIERHARALAEELTDVFREDVWPAYVASAVPAPTVQEGVASFHPLTIQAFAAAYERWVDEAKRATAERRLRRRRESAGGSGGASGV